MIKNKKIIGLSILTIIILFSAGVLYWKNQQKIIKTEETNIVDNNSSEKAEVKIPEGIEVTEETEEGYRITNNADNYSFTLPESWKEITGIDYRPEEVAGDRAVSLLWLIGETSDQQIIISKFENDLSDINIRNWTDKLFSDFNLTVDSTDHKIGDMDVVIITMKDEASMDSFFFQKESNIYGIGCKDKETTEDIIINGEW